MEDRCVSARFVHGIRHRVILEADPRQCVLRNLSNGGLVLDQKNALAHHRISSSAAVTDDISVSRDDT